MMRQFLVIVFVTIHFLSVSQHREPLINIKGFVMDSITRNAIYKVTVRLRERTLLAKTRTDGSYEFNVAGLEIFPDEWVHLSFNDSLYFPGQIHVQLNSTGSITEVKLLRIPKGYYLHVIDCETNENIVGSIIRSSVLSDSIIPLKYDGYYKIEITDLIDRKNFALTIEPNSIYNRDTVSFQRIPNKVVTIKRQKKIPPLILKQYPICRLGNKEPKVYQKMIDWSIILGAGTMAGSYISYLVYKGRALHDQNEMGISYRNEGVKKANTSRQVLIWSGIATAVLATVDIIDFGLFIHKRNQGCQNKNTAHIFNNTKISLTSEENSVALSIVKKF